MYKHIKSIILSIVPYFFRLKLNLKKSIENIKGENYKNYFIYAYNKDYYRIKKKSSKNKTSSKRRKPKIYKT